MLWTLRAESASFRHISNVPHRGWVLATFIALLGSRFGAWFLRWIIACFDTSIGDPQYPMTTANGRIGTLGRMCGSRFFASGARIFASACVFGVAHGGGERPEWHLCHWSLTCMKMAQNCGQSDTRMESAHAVSSLPQHCTERRQDASSHALR